MSLFGKNKDEEQGKQMKEIQDVIAKDVQEILGGEKDVEVHVLPPMNLGKILEQEKDFYCPENQHEEDMMLIGRVNALYCWLKYNIAEAKRSSYSSYTVSIYEVASIIGFDDIVPEKEEKE